MNNIIKALQDKDEKKHMLCLRKLEQDQLHQMNTIPVLMIFWGS